MKTRRHTNTQIILPGANAWELWQIEDASLKRSQTFENEESSVAVQFNESASQERVYGIPSTKLTTIPLWIQVPEAETATAIGIQLEVKGIKPTGGSNWNDYRIARKEDSRRLAVISVLDGSQSSLAPSSATPTAMRPASDFLPFDANKATLYKELGVLTIAVTRDSEIVYQAPLITQSPDADAAREIVQIILQLQFDGVIENISGLDLWIDDVDATPFVSGTGLQVKSVKRPDPVLPSSAPLALETPDITEKKSAAQSSSRIRKIALIAGSSIAALVFALVLTNTLINWKRDALLEEIAELTPRASSVSSDIDRWNELAPAVDRDQFPLEILHRLGQIPSVRGVSLTSFEASPGKIEISGRASATGAALKFGGDVSRGAYLPEYRWNFPDPQIAADDSATFTLTGTRAQPDET